MNIGTWRCNFRNTIVAQYSLQIKGRVWGTKQYISGSGSVLELDHIINRIVVLCWLIQWFLPEYVRNLQNVNDIRVFF